VRQVLKTDCVPAWAPPSLCSSAPFERGAAGWCRSIRRNACVLSLTLSSFFFSPQNSPAPHLLQLIFFWDTMNCNTHTHTGSIPCSLPLPLFASSSRSWSWSLGRFSFPFREGDPTPMKKEKKSCGFTGWFGATSAMESRVSLVYLRNKLFQTKVQCLQLSRPLRWVLSIPNRSEGVQNGVIGFLYLPYYFVGAARNIYASAFSATRFPGPCDVSLFLFAKETTHR